MASLLSSLLSLRQTMAIPVLGSTRTPACEGAGKNAAPMFLGLQAGERTLKRVHTLRDIFRQENPENTLRHAQPWHGLRPQPTAPSCWLLDSWRSGLCVSNRRNYLVRLQKGISRVQSLSFHPTIRNRRHRRMKCSLVRDRGVRARHLCVRVCVCAHASVVCA